MKLLDMKIPSCNKPGVYAIHNKMNDKYYIGSSMNIHNRTRIHRNMIFTYGSINTKMSKDVKTSKDIENLEFMQLYIFDSNVSEKELRYKEHEFIIQLDSINNGYNTCKPKPIITHKHKNKSNDTLDFYATAEQFEKFTARKPFLFES